MADPIPDGGGPATVGPISGPDRASAPSDGRQRRRRRRGVEARRVRRVVRTVDAWSVLKVAALFTACLWLIVMVAGVIVWSVAASTGTVGNLESFTADLLAQEDFTIDGRRVFQASLVAGLILVAAGTAFAGLLTVLFNLISELTGGVRMTVVELEHTRPARGRRRRARRRGEPGADAAADVEDVAHPDPAEGAEAG
jgi:hypothetical protein